MISSRIKKQQENIVFNMEPFAILYNRSIECSKNNSNKNTWKIHDDSDINKKRTSKK